MNLNAVAEDAGLMIVAGVVANWLTASTVNRIIRENRRDEDAGVHADDDFPGMRRSLHFIRQDISGILVAAIYGNGILAAIAVALLLQLAR
jgi:hypothetical protein